jgi:hypothetical protein
MRILLLVVSSGFIASAATISVALACLECACSELVIEPQPKDCLELPALGSTLESAYRWHSADKDK